MYFGFYVDLGLRLLTTVFHTWTFVLQGFVTLYESGNIYIYIYKSSHLRTILIAVYIYIDRYFFKRGRGSGRQ